MSTGLYMREMKTRRDMRTFPFIVVIEEFHHRNGRVFYSLQLLHLVFTYTSFNFISKPVEVKMKTLLFHFHIDMAAVTRP